MDSVRVLLDNFLDFKSGRIAKRGRQECMKEEVGGKRVKRVHYIGSDIAFELR